jgi:hypothetical protein
MTIAKIKPSKAEQIPCSGAGNPPGNPVTMVDLYLNKGKGANSVDFGCNFLSKDGATCLAAAEAT